MKNTARSTTATMPLASMLQSQGFGSRRWCRELVEAGDVVVNGATLRDPDVRVPLHDLVFSVYGESWTYRAKLYLCLNKPAGVECSRKPQVHRGVLSLLPDQFSRRDVQPVGRLDHDTTGMLLLSDDGAFIHAQSSPKRHVPKVYVATTQDAVTSALIDSLLKGVQLHDEPAPLAAIYCHMVDSHQIEIILEQGKYHQVKRMLAAAGNHCRALQRVAIGGLTLESLRLADGEWCYLDESELIRLAQPAAQTAAHNVGVG
jgi:16S rRNA pseudouridine516 synthase